MPREALGLIETRDMIGAIEVTRAATKAAELVIISAEQNGSGRVTVKIEGSWGAVLSAVEAGARAAEKVGQLVSMHLIGNPDENLSSILPYQLFIDRFRPHGVVTTPRKVSGSKLVAPKTARAPRPASTEKAAPSKSAVPKAATLKPASARAITPKPVPSPKAAIAQTPVQSAAVPMPSMAELEAMPVVKLRQFARSLPNLPIQGRQISMANKTQLLEAIRLIHRN